MTLHHVLKDLQYHSSNKRAKSSMRFFNQSYTAKNDRFIGVTMPDLRKVAKRHPEVSIQDIRKLLNSNIHEYRMLGGIILISKFKNNPEEIFKFYLEHTVNFYNWDLVDVTCTHIVGKFLLDRKKERKILYSLVKSKNLWEKRIAIISTFEFIRHNDFGDTLKISEILLKDKHDLIHKAIGWMLREVGKRNKEVLLDFLKTNYKKLPRVTLRYAIERFPEEKRKEMLKGEFL
jgi:3-methyladenine DNA glycosylase AlkD